MATQTTPTIEEQLAALDREEQDAERARRRNEDARRLERGNLRKLGVSKYGGEEGKTFNIVETPIGYFLVHKVGGVMFKQLRKSTMSDPDVEEFVKAHLEPEDGERFLKAITDYDALLNTVFLSGCANLHGARLEERAKK